MIRILVADDEPDVVGIVQLAFQFNRPNYVLDGAYSGTEVMERLKDHSYDLLLLDVSMPEPDGFEITRRMRQRSHVPIVLLTARAMEQDKVRGLELGADDYVTKPFSHKELIARVDAVLRRTSMHAGDTSAIKRISYRDLEIDPSSNRVTLGGEAVSLTPTEYRLLYQLASNRGRVMTHDMLLRKVWGEVYKTEPQYLKVYIRRLREKLERDPAQPEYVLTVRGVGYTFPAEGKRENSWHR